MSTSDVTDCAAVQHGVVSAAQLEELGVSEKVASAHTRAGRWQRPHRGVYATFSGQLDRMATIWAALLRCGSDAVASHQTAAELDGLCEQVDERVHVTVGARRRVRGKHTGVVVHYANRLPHTRHPAKSPPRTRLDDTVLDLVDTATTALQAANWVITAVQKRHTTTERLAERLAGRKKIRWRPMIESMLLDVADGAHSMLEMQHLRRVERAHGLPTAKRQRRTSGKRVIWIDVDHEEFATRVELDGRIGHEGEGMFRDRRRDNRGTVGGYWTLRYGSAEVFGTPCEVAAEEAVVLQDRGWAGQPEPCNAECTMFAAMAQTKRERAA